MPTEMFEKLVKYANERGKPEGRPYFSYDGKTPMSPDDWAKTRTIFNCPHGVTNVWQRPALRGPERIKTHGTHGKAVHLNQKPLDLMNRIINASNMEGAVVWEPFGGLFTGSVAAKQIGIKSFAAEIDPTYFHYGLQRIIELGHQDRLL